MLTPEDSELVDEHEGNKVRRLADRNDMSITEGGYVNSAALSQSCRRGKEDEIDVVAMLSDREEQSNKENLP